MCPKGKIGMETSKDVFVPFVVILPSFFFATIPLDIVLLHLIVDMIRCLDTKSEERIEKFSEVLQIYYNCRNAKDDSTQPLKRHCETEL